jgi:uncharacterized hydrophobic protein (TIGR00271 family)
MPIKKLFQQSDKEKNDAIKELINNSSPRHGFFLMIGLAVIMTTMGIILDNIIIIIGGMLVAPLLYPILGMALGVIIFDLKATLRSMVTIIKSAILAISLAIIISFIFFQNCQNLNLIQFINPTIYLEYFIIAFVAGLAASVALMKPNVNESIPGVAISVALIPPLSILGIGIALMQNYIILPAINIFLINILGITIASALTFSTMKLSNYKKKIQQAVQNDEKIIQKIEKEENK